MPEPTRSQTFADLWLAGEDEVSWMNGALGTGHNLAATEKIEEKPPNLPTAFFNPCESPSWTLRWTCTT